MFLHSGALSNNLNKLSGKLNGPDIINNPTEVMIKPNEKNGAKIGAVGPLCCPANAISALALNQLTPQWLLMSRSFPVLSVCLCEAAVVHFFTVWF